MTQHNKYILPIILFLAPISGMGIDIYTPSLPNIALVFGASHVLIKTLYLFIFLDLLLGKFFPVHYQKYMVANQF